MEKQRWLDRSFHAEVKLCCPPRARAGDRGLVIVGQSPQAVCVERDEIRQLQLCLHLSSRCA